MNDIARVSERASERASERRASERRASQAIQQVYLSRVTLGASGKRKTISCAPGIANDDHTVKKFFSAVSLLLAQLAIV